MRPPTSISPRHLTSRFNVTQAPKAGRVTRWPLLSRTLLALALAGTVASHLSAAEVTPPNQAADNAVTVLQAKVQKAGPAATPADWAALAEACEKAGRVAEAASALTSAITAGYKAPANTVGANQRLGRLWEASGNFDKAAIAYKAAAEVAGLDPKLASESALQAGQVVKGFIGDPLWAAKEFIALVKRWPGTPAARQALVQISSIDANTDDLRKIRVLASEYVVKQFPGDKDLVGLASEQFTRMPPKLGWELYTAYTKAAPALNDLPIMCWTRAQLQAGNGQPEEAYASYRLATTKSGDPRWLWEAAQVTKKPDQAAQTILEYANYRLTNPDNPDWIQRAANTGGAIPAVQAAIALGEKRWNYSADRLARLALARAHTETDPVKRTAAWLAVATATLADGNMPGDLLNELIATANSDVALLSGMQKLYASKAASEGKPLTLGLAIARSLHQTAGDDAVKLEAAKDQFVACLRDYAMINPEFFVWGVQWFRELMWHVHFTGDAVVAGCNSILSVPLEVEYMRRALPARYGDLYSLKKIDDRFAALKKLAETQPAGVEGDMYTAYVGASGNTEKQAKILYEYTTVHPKELTKNALNWARSSALYLAERNGLREQVPVWAQQMWQSFKDSKSADQYIYRVRQFESKALFEDAQSAVKASLGTGSPAENASMAINGAGVLRLAGHPEEAWALLNKTFGAEYDTWSWEALAQGIASAAPAKDLAGYEKIFRASVVRDGGSTFQGLVGWHGLADEPMRAKLLKELSVSPDPALAVWVLSWLAERQRGEDFPGFLASYKTMRERSPNPNERLEYVINLGWEGALARKDRALMKSFAADLRRSVETSGRLGDWNRFGQVIQQVVESGVMVEDLDPAAAAIERRAWLELLVNNGGASGWATWAARRIVEDQRPTDPVAAAITIQRLVRTGWRDNPDDFDRVLAEIVVERDAGRIGVAAGAFAHMAKWFNPDRVSVERIQTAQRLASDCQARLGSLQEIDSKDPRAPLLRAGALLAAGDEIEAYRLAKANEKMLESSLAAVPSDLVLLVARNRIREERYADARTLLVAFGRTLNDSPASADAASRTRYLIGEAFFHEGNHQAAQTEYQTVIATWPKHPQAAEARLRIGDCAYAQRQVPQARAAFEQLLMADDKLVRIKARYRLALLASAEGQKDEAFKMFRELAIDNPPKEVANELYLDWGKQLIDSNRLKEAEDVLALVGRSNNREPVAPGEPLRITLQDTYLQASSNRASVPVEIKTASGDREIIDLNGSQETKGFFTGSIQTTLGTPVVGDHLLQISGDDRITYDYTPAYLASRPTLVSAAQVEIRVVSDGELKAAASSPETSFIGEPGVKQAVDVEVPEDGVIDLKRIGANNSFRNRTQIKPGNPIYVAVQDLDQDLSDKVDHVTVLMRSTTGDQVSAALDETGEHTGLFRGAVRTGVKPPDLQVSDSAPGSDPLQLLRQPTDPDFDRADRAWVARGDQRTGKTVTIDLKGSVMVDSLVWSRGAVVAAGKSVPVAKVVPWTPGLSGTFFSGVDFSGNIVHTMNDAPVYENIDLPEHGRDNYSDRWTGEVQIPAKGKWTFQCISDDGIRMFANGKMLFEDWNGHGPTPFSATIECEAGWLPVVIEHFQGGGGAFLNFSIAPEGKPLQVVTKDQLRSKVSNAAANAAGTDRRLSSYRVECSADGAIWTPIFSSTASAGSPMAGTLATMPAKVRRLTRGNREAAKNLTDLALSGQTSAVATSAIAFPADDAAAKEKTDWYGSGRILIPTAGSYEFAVRSKGRCWMKIGDTMVVEKERDEADAAPVANVDPKWRGRVDNLPFGHQVISILANSDKGAADIQLLWRRPGTKDFEPVPTAAINAQADDKAVGVLTGKGVAKAAPLADRFGAEIAFPAFSTRFLRLVMNRWEDGDAPALSSVRVYSGKTLVLPAPGIDYHKLITDDVLDLSAGESVDVSYLDERNKRGKSDTLRARLDATYFNGKIRFLDARNEVVRGELREVLNDRYRFKAGDRLTVQITDLDADISNAPDSLDVVFTSAKGPITVKATETGPATGIFQAEIKTENVAKAGDAKAADGKSTDGKPADVKPADVKPADVKPTEAKPADSKPAGDKAAGAAKTDSKPAGRVVLLVADGEQVSASYLDQSNTIPGNPVRRTVSIRNVVDGRGQVGIYSSKLKPPEPVTAAAPLTPGERVRRPEVDYGEAGTNATVALAPLQIAITDPSALISAASRVRARISTASGIILDVLLKPDSQNNDIGLFSGTVVMVLGDGQGETWRLPSPTDEKTTAIFAEGKDLPEGAQPVLPIQGSEVITVTYLAGINSRSTPEQITAAATKVDISTATARLVSKGLLTADDGSDHEVTELHVGGELHLQVTDPDADLTSERDSVTIKITTGLRDSLDLVAEETEGHSGIFTATVPVALAAKADSTDQVLQTGFGDSVTAVYIEDGKPAATLKLPVAKGSNADLIAFARRYGDDSLEARTQVRLAECYFELYKSHREELKTLKSTKAKSDQIARLQKVITDELAQGTSLLQRTIRDWGDSEEQDQLLFLLGNFEQEGGQQASAIVRYSNLLASFPDSERAPEAQFKIAQCYEGLERWDDAWDAYVRLAYRWPKHDLVGDAMVRIGLFYRNRAKAVIEALQKEDPDVERPKLTKAALDDLHQAAEVYGKFLERFPAHAIAEKIALAQADSLLQAGDWLKARALFDQVAQKYPTSAAKGFYWAGIAALEAGQTKDCFLRFQTLLTMYPETTEAKYARGKIASDRGLSAMKKTIAEER